MWLDLSFGPLEVMEFLYWATLPFWTGLIPGVLLGKLWPRLGVFEGTMTGFVVGFNINAVAVGTGFFVLVAGIRIPVSSEAYMLAPVASLAATVGICWWNGGRAQGAD